ncbi:hypothetical protein BDV96DRAFT_649952 [Lophiotrema nucula]|uniref:BZIP domain-containing protein n=1 Tax=Lophiotrema nucula TaxID=690887 RepID=A0A6A5YZ60_9PLEO|nr:hypothetical protein BDV96DRAFT_649952 [Lophiotrema nucula]
MANTQPLSILLKCKAELKDAREEQDDWTGKSDAKERRKLQNRLHQRAWRRKKAGRRTEVPLAIREGESMENAFARAVAAFTAGAEETETTSARDRAGSSSTSSTSSTITLTPNYRPALITFVPKTNPLIPPVITYISPSTPPSSAPAFVFPLSPDHYLLTLVQYNVLRAVITNLQLCSLLSHLPSECRAALNIPTPPPPSTIPPSFAPTHTQSSVPHPSWIDTVPCPQLRDNLILTQGRWDEDELCGDMCGGLYEGYDDVVQRGLLVWDEPWRVGSWEVSTGFVEKWGWLLKGCTEMERSTNLWREGRGEDKLNFEVEWSE